jgi:Flp pilus assembly protein TadD
MGIGGDDPAPAASPTASTAPVTDNLPVNATEDTASLEKSLPTDLPGEIERAHLLRVRGAYPDAEKALAQMMLIAPDNPQVVGEYGKTLLQEGRAREAVNFLKRAAQISPKDWTIYSAMGVAFDQAGDHADAKLAYNRALAIKPGEPTVLNNLAVSRALSGDAAGAKVILAKASMSGADQPKIANNLAAVDTMQPASVQKPVTTSAPQKPVTMAGQPPAPASTVPQQTTTMPKPVTQAALAPANAAPQKFASTNTPATTADEKKLGPGVVMQAVPVDPQAGPVHAPVKTVAAKTAKKPVAKLAEPTKLAAAKPEAKVSAPPPTLRTASDAN